MTNETARCEHPSYECIEVSKPGFQGKYCLKCGEFIVPSTTKEGK